MAGRLTLPGCGSPELIVMHGFSAWEGDGRDADEDGEDVLCPWPGCRYSEVSTPSAMGESGGYGVVAR